MMSGSLTKVGNRCSTATEVATAFWAGVYHFPLLKTIVQIKVCTAIPALIGILEMEEWLDGRTSRWKKSE